MENQFDYDMEEEYYVEMEKEQTELEKVCNVFSEKYPGINSDTIQRIISNLKPEFRESYDVFDKSYFVVYDYYEVIYHEPYDGEIERHDDRADYLTKSFETEKEMKDFILDCLFDNNSISEVYVNQKLKKLKYNHQVELLDE